MRVETCLDWASQSASPHEKQQRLHLVCGLAACLHAEDERHEVPHGDALGRKAITPHALRHACALHTLEATGDIRQVALWPDVSPDSA